MQNLNGITNHFLHPFTCDHSQDEGGGFYDNHSLSGWQKTAVVASAFFTFLATSSFLLTTGCFFAVSALMKRLGCKVSSLSPSSIQPDAAVTSQSSFIPPLVTGLLGGGLVARAWMGRSGSLSGSGERAELTHQNTFPWENSPVHFAL